MSPQNQQPQLTESLQQLIARTIALNPAGEGLGLIGGFRYRLLNGSARLSTDIDYHWPGSLEDKRQELIALFKRRLLPEARRSFGLDGAIHLPGPEESPSVKTVEVAFFKTGESAGRIEIPVDITMIQCMDKPVARTRNGVVYLTVSDADMVESKVLSLLLRTFTAQRDLLDLFLFENTFKPDSPARLQTKLQNVGITRDAVESAIKKLADNRIMHVKGLRQVIQSQLEESVRKTIEAGGGADMVFDSAYNLVQRVLI